MQVVLPWVFENASAVFPLEVDWFGFRIAELMIRRIVVLAAEEFAGKMVP